MKALCATEAISLKPRPTMVTPWRLTAAAPWTDKAANPLTYIQRSPNTNGTLGNIGMAFRTRAKLCVLPTTVTAVPIWTRSSKVSGTQQTLGKVRKPSDDAQKLSPPSHLQFTTEPVTPTGGDVHEFEGIITYFPLAWLAEFRAI